MGRGATNWQNTGVNTLGDFVDGVGVVDVIDILDAPRPFLITFCKSTPWLIVNVWLNYFPFGAFEWSL